MALGDLFLTIGYHNFFKSLSTVDELDIVQDFVPAKNLRYGADIKAIYRIGYPPYIVGAPTIQK